MRQDKIMVIVIFFSCCMSGMEVGRQKTIESMAKVSLIVWNLWVCHWLFVLPQLIFEDFDLINELIWWILDTQLLGKLMIDICLVLFIVYVSTSWVCVCVFLPHQSMASKEYQLKIFKLIKFHILAIWGRGQHNIISSFADTKFINIYFGLCVRY